jgi:ADP-ribosylglycohydrolase
MRTHPLGVICIDKSQEYTFRIATEFSIITHADPRCVLACCISTALIRGILRGDIQNEQDVDAMIDVAFKWVHSWQKRGRKFKSEPVVVVEEEWVDAGMNTSEIGDVEEQIQESTALYTKPEPLLDRVEFYKHVRAENFQELQLDDSMTMGYVYKSLGAAIVALRSAMKSDWSGSEERRKYSNRTIFENLITEIVMEGGDADTNACVAGALLGAWLGYMALPAHWCEGIEHHDWLVSKCDALMYVLGIKDFAVVYKGSEDPDAMEDGGNGFLNRSALEARETAFMETYLRKRAEKKASQSKDKGWKVRLFSN